MADEVQNLSYRNGTVKELSFPEPTLENRVIHILHHTLRLEVWGYKNEVRLRGLTENQDFGNPRRRVCVCLAAVSTARCKI